MPTLETQPDPSSPLQWPAASPARPLAWAAVLVLHGAALTGLAYSYRQPLGVALRAPVEVFMLPTAKPPTVEPAVPVVPVSLESPSAVMVPIPSLQITPAEPETARALAGVPLVESVPPPELSAAPLPALGPEALNTMALQLPEDRIRFLRRPPLEPSSRLAQARLALRFEADGSLRRVELLRSSGKADWDEQALAAWRAVRIEPQQRDGRSLLIYTEVEQALPLP